MTIMLLIIVLYFGNQKKDKKTKKTKTLFLFDFFLQLGSNFSRHKSLIAFY